MPIVLPRPREMPAYVTAAAQHRLPPITANPPQLQPGATANQRLIRLAIGGGILFVLAIITTTFLQTAPFARVLVPIVMIGGFLVIVVMAINVQNTLLRELQRGYTTLPLRSFGLATHGRWRQATVGGGNLTWDYRGTWVLDNAGGIRTAPDTAFDAPGYYPSPDRPDRYELWTGVSWAGWYLRAKSR